MEEMIMRRISPINTNSQSNSSSSRSRPSTAGSFNTPHLFTGIAQGSVSSQREVKLGGKVEITASFETFCNNLNNHVFARSKFQELKKASETNPNVMTAFKEMHATWFAATDCSMMNMYGIEDNIVRKYNFKSTDIEIIFDMLLQHIVSPAQGYMSYSSS
jgi:hypothetical protein